MTFSDRDVDLTTSVQGFNILIQKTPHIPTKQPKTAKLLSVDGHSCLGSTQRLKRVNSECLYCTGQAVTDYFQ